jgi:hypothetical protein
MERKHSVEQIIRILEEVEKSGLKISDACRPLQITDQTYDRWKRSGRMGGWSSMRQGGSRSWRRRTCV